jgi:hypothetical protein
MGWIAALIQRLKDDWRDLLALLRGEFSEEVSVVEVMMATMPPAPDQDIDWFVWECEQYAKSPVFWFDPWRYAGTPWAYPEPTEAQRRRVWNASLRRAIDAYGEAAVRRQGIKLAAEIEGTPREDEYFHQPDPWAWAMSQAVH